jgi:hypothetical protein
MSGRIIAVAFSHCSPHCQRTRALECVHAETASEPSSERASERANKANNERLGKPTSLCVQLRVDVARDRTDLSAKLLLNVE